MHPVVEYDWVSVVWWIVTMMRSVCGRVCLKWVEDWDLPLDHPLEDCCMQLSTLL